MPGRTSDRTPPATRPSGGTGRMHLASRWVLCCIASVAMALFLVGPAGAALVTYTPADDAAPPVCSADAVASPTGPEWSTSGFPDSSATSGDTTTQQGLDAAVSSAESLASSNGHLYPGTPTAVTTLEADDPSLTFVSDGSAGSLGPTSLSVDTATDGEGIDPDRPVLQRLVLGGPQQPGRGCQRPGVRASHRALALLRHRPGHLVRRLLRGPTRPAGQPAGDPRHRGPAGPGRRDRGRGPLPATTGRPRPGAGGASSPPVGHPGSPPPIRDASSRAVARVVSTASEGAPESSKSAPVA